MKRLLIILSIICSTLNGLQAQFIESKANVNDSLLARAAQFKEAIAVSEGYRSGVYIYDKRTVADYRKNPEELAARLALFGFTDVYLGVNRLLTSGNSDEIKWVVTFNTTAHELGMKVHLLSLSSSKLWIDNNKIVDDCRQFVDFNYINKKAVRFDGISADLEPHIMKKGHVERPKDLVWEWHGTDNYGIGKDNDLLCKRMVEVMQKARKELGKNFELSQAQGFFLQRRFDAGELSAGSAHQLLQSCSHLVVMAYNYQPQRVFEMAQPSLENADAHNFTKSVSIAIKTSLDTYGSEGPVTSFQPQAWEYLIDAIRFLIKRGKEYSSFRGIDIFEFQGLELMFNKQQED